MIEVYDINNKVIKCELLFTFEKNNKNFIVYMDSDDNILSSYYKNENGKFIIMPIDDEEDYDLVDAELEKWWNKNE